MNIDTFINIVQTISTLAAAGFGVIALTKEAKNKTGKLTQWGRTALIGVFSSAMLALVLQTLQSAKAKKDAEDAQAKTNATTKLLSTIIDTSNASLNKQRISLAKTQKIADTLDSSYKVLIDGTKKTKAISDSLKKSLVSEQFIVSEQQQSEKQLIGIAYPLEPIVMEFAKVYSMDDPLFKTYITRIEEHLSDFTKDNKSGKGYYYLQYGSKWLPNEKDECYIFLIYDQTQFIFSNGKKNQDIDMDAQTELNDTSRKVVNGVKSDFQIFMNFKNREIGKMLTCTNVKCYHNLDNLSAVDLLNRKLTWLVNSPVKWYMDNMLLNFSFQFEKNAPGGHSLFGIDKNNQYMLITPIMLGLNQSIDSPHYNLKEIRRQKK